MAANKSKILVVDDEAYICSIVAESLDASRYVVETFTDPAQALVYLEEHHVDLVLTDLMMGKYSGLDILDAAVRFQPDSVMILMTAHPTVQLAVSTLKKGAYDFLVKPFKLERLVQTVERGLEHRRVVQENLVLKGQVGFLRAANAFIGHGADLDYCLKMILRSCNTEFSASASAIMEVDPETGDLTRQLHVSNDDRATELVLQWELVEQFRKPRRFKPIVQMERVTYEGRSVNQFLISQPIFVRRTLRGVINVLTRSRRQHMPAGRMDILTLLAGSAASAIANQKLYNDLQQSYFQAIRALTNAIEARDHYTGGHTDRVTRLAEQVAARLGWDDSQIEHLRIGCTLHDIGKIGVPDAILNKASRLTDKERERMQKHPQLGLKIIRDVDILKPCIPYLISHHERYDGAGYPNGLKGEKIPIEGRLLAVVDTFDAVMSDRPYRQGASLEVAVNELIEHAGTQFDPYLVDVFLEVLRSGIVNLRELYEQVDDLSCLDQTVLTETVPV